MLGLNIGIIGEYDKRFKSIYVIWILANERKCVLFLDLLLEECWLFVVITYGNKIDVIDVITSVNDIK